MIVGIVDYGLGNIASVRAAVERVGGKPVVTFDADVLRKCDRLIIPGVGAFADGMARLRQRGLIPVLDELVIAGRKPVLGICLGFQMLGRRSYEFGETAGLGWIDAEVLPLRPNDPKIRVPHVGWNDVQIRRRTGLFRGVPDGALFYYVHSFYMECASDGPSVGVCDYGQAMTVVVEQGNIFGTQFHPEKSQRQGLAVLRNFISGDLECSASG